jgi:hypothetical protein
VTAEFSMPEQPGDSAAALRFERSPNAATAAYSLIPISLRTLIPTTATGGSFTGTLTGGNSRPDVGPTQTFAFDVPAGVGNMSLVLEIPDNGYLLEGLLVDPHGVQLSVAANQDPITGSAQFGMQLAHYNPEPGQWKFVLLQNFTSSGNQTSLPFTARLGFNTAQVAASGLPDAASVKLSASAKPVAVPIQITNTGTTTQLYFADARLSSPTLIELPDQPGCSPATTLPGACGLFFVPTQASTVSFAAQSVAPITMDAFNDVGTGVGGTVSPDVYSMKVAPDTVIASFGAPEVPYSAWISEPSLIGPYKAAGTPTEPVTLGAFAFALPFDPAVSADSGDEWADLTLGTSTFNPLILAPGQTGTITLTVTPDAKEVGSTVTGFVYVDTFSLTVFTGDEVVRLPYSYTIVK